MLAKAKKEKEKQELDRAIAAGKRPNRKKGQVEAEILRKPTDMRDDPQYQGGTVVMLKFIPNKCVDEKTVVDEATMREFVLCAIIEEDPYSKRFFQEIHRIHAVIEEIDNNLRQIPKLEFLDEDGQPLTDEKARVEREIIFNKFSDDRAKADEEMIAARQQLQNHINWRKTMGLDFTKGDHDLNTDTVTWYCKLFGTNDSLEIEHLLLAKLNWPGIKLAAGNPRASPPIPPWAGRGDIPDGKKAGQFNYLNFQVAVSGARISRVPAGVGLIQTLDRASSSLYDENFSFFYGEFESGKKNGYGISITDEGVHAGTYENGFRRGYGRMDYADGTTLVGTFAPCNSNKKLLETSGFQNPYKDGEPNGLVEINFSDGAFYRGHMANGRISGTGDYQSAFNEVQSGTFEYGALTCEKGFMQNSNEDVYVGNFVNGELHGKGTFMSKHKDNYDGYWQHFFRHGRGISHTGTAGEYRGYYLNNLKHGKASQAYGNSRAQARAKQQRKEEKERVAAKEKDEAEKKAAKADANIIGNSPKKSALPAELKAKDKTVSEEKDDNEEEELKPLSDYDNIFLGYVMGNSLANGGCYMNTEVQMPSIISRLNKRTCYAIFREMNKEVRHNKQANRLLEKYTDMEHHIREEIQKKKVKIFRQQKHYTKKSMYQEDMFGGVGLTELKAKLYLRQERLKNMKPEKVPVSKALVPRLRLLNNKPYTRMTEAFERIRPDKSMVRDEDKINNELVQIVLSDFEEMKERQRFLKYDLIWQRAENAFSDANRSAAEKT